MRTKGYLAQPNTWPYNHGSQPVVAVTSDRIRLSHASPSGICGGQDGLEIFFFGIPQSLSSHQFSELTDASPKLQRNGQRHLGIR